MSLKNVTTSSAFFGSLRASITLSPCLSTNFLMRSVYGTSESLEFHGDLLRSILFCAIMPWIFRCKNRVSYGLNFWNLAMQGFWSVSSITNSFPFTRGWLNSSGCSNRSRFARACAMNSLLSYLLASVSIDTSSASTVLITSAFRCRSLLNMLNRALTSGFCSSVTHSHSSTGNSSGFSPSSSVLQCFALNCSR